MVTNFQEWFEFNFWTIDTIDTHLLNNYSRQGDRGNPARPMLGGGITFYHVLGFPLVLIKYFIVFKMMKLKDDQMLIS